MATPEEFKPGLYAVTSRGSCNYRNIQNTAQMLGIECLVPMQEVLSLKGKKRSAPVLGQRYAFVILEDNSSYSKLRDSGVVTFVGNHDHFPGSLSPEDVRRLHNLDRNAGIAAHVSYDISEGDSVSVKGGKLSGIDGIVQEIDPEKGIATVVSDSLFGRSAMYNVPLSYLVKENNAMVLSGR